MENFLKDAIRVPLDSLWPDPNNPRLALEDAPGYEDPKALYDPKMRERIFGKLGESAYNVSDLVDMIAGQGWMPIDNIIVWKHPKDGHYTVVEGNRRRLALEQIRGKELPKEQDKLKRMLAKSSGYTKKELQDQKDHVAALERIVADTAKLSVVPLDANSVEELDHKLPRVLAVRHITGAKVWGNYAEDVWLLKRFEQIFEDRHPKKDLRWEKEIVECVAAEASMGSTEVKRRLRAASLFRHFAAEWEDQLPEGEEFIPEDYYLFEQICKRPWLRKMLRVDSEDATVLPPESERALFEWVFKLLRGKNADQNPNKFFRHENISVLDQIHSYDEKHGTSFAMRFDVDNPAEAPMMREVEAEYLSHKAQRKPHAVLNDLIQRLSELKAKNLASEGEAFRSQLTQLRSLCDSFIKMIDATSD